MKEIVLYTSINNYSAEDYITRLEAFKNNDISVRMNCPGGDVYAAYGMIAKFSEHKKGKEIKVDGYAASCGFFMCCAADNVECLDVSEFIAHRAALPAYVENNKDAFTPELKAHVNMINSQLRAIVEARKLQAHH
jgi:ATP-dependent protease ClpP protease subunit